MACVNSLVKELKSLGNPDLIALKAKKFGIKAENSLGIYQKDIKAIAKTIGTNDELARSLYDTGIYEARLLCSKIHSHKTLNSKLMDSWANDFENWEICDSFCMGLFSKSDLALSKLEKWAKSKKEFTRRASFVIMASYGFADKNAPNEVFESFFTHIFDHSTDERTYVKKAVNWALRNIGKRNKDLRMRAIEAAQELLKKENKTASWIAKDALKELENPKVRISDYPRSIYRS